MTSMKNSSADPSLRKKHLILLLIKQIVEKKLTLYQISAKNVIEIILKITENNTEIIFTCSQFSR